MQTPQNEKAKAFQALHIAGDPVILFNIWDAGSAKAVIHAGAKALATGSWSVASANGFADGEQLPRALLMNTLKAIAGLTDLPVTVDLESGFGEGPAEVGQTIGLSVNAGAIGCNLEDSFPIDGTLRPVAQCAARLKAARGATEATCPDYFINARTDVFFQKPADEHDSAMVAEAIERGKAYAAAGANGLFVPGLTNLALIGELVAASPVPVNIMRLGDGPDIKQLAALGVARISHGPHPYMLAMNALEQAARAASGS